MDARLCSDIALGNRQRLARAAAPLHHNAPMQIVDAETTRGLLPFDLLIAALRAKFIEGCEAPLRHTHRIETMVDGVSGGNLLLMPAWQAGRFLGIKTVSVFPGNAALGLPGLHSIYLLLDARTGVPLLQLDGNEITSRRTAAASALAASYLAREDASRLLIVGAGRVASLLAQAYRAMRPITQVRVWNRSAAASVRLVSQLQAEGIDADATTDLESSVLWADIISCPTLSTLPLVHGVWLRPGSHLDLIGAFTPAMRESDDACFSGTRVFVDTEEAVAKAGDLLEPMRSGVFKASDVQATLAQLCESVGIGAAERGADGRWAGAGALGIQERGHPDGTVGVLHRVPDPHWVVVALAGKLSAGLRQSERPEQGRSSGHLDAVDSLWPQALFARDRDPLRRRQSGTVGHAQGDQRRRHAAGPDRPPDAAGVAWLDRHLDESVEALLDAPWILDVDTTVKPLYGKQEGAVISYNPKKPGRPSHTYHTYLMAGLRLVVGAEVRAGDEHSGSHSLPGLLKILDALPAARRPGIVCGDCGFGANPIMAPLEERGQSYLFKLRLSKNVKRRIERVFWDTDWSDAGQGWEGKDGRLRLSGWISDRRVIVLRRPLKGEMPLAPEDHSQGLLGFVEADRKAGKRVTGYEHAVLVTNLDHEILALGQLYRDRADAENAFDELRNQWGWGGFTTHDLHSCQQSARAVALIYNWWSLFVRLANPQARREAITSRPWLMSAVGRKTEHAGQTTITLTGLHADFAKARDALMHVSTMLQHWTRRVAEQLNPTTVWNLVCDHLKLVLAAFAPPQPRRRFAFHASGSG